jgi:hypothetical protein
LAKAVATRLGIVSSGVLAAKRGFDVSRIKKISSMVGFMTASIIKLSRV